MKDIYQQLVENIEYKNRETKELVNFDNIFRNNLQDLIYKIIDSSVSKYKNFFIVDGEFDNTKYLDYLNTVFMCIDTNFMQKEQIEVDDILYLHQTLFSIYNEEQLQDMSIKKTGKFRDGPIMTYNLHEDKTLKNRNYFISHNKVEKKMLETINNYNTSNKSIVDISIFFHTCISSIHPFFNGNGRVFFILIDILLLKNNYLPIFIKQDKGKYEDIIQTYFFDRNFKTLILHFLDFISYKYTNYTIK